MSRHYAPPAEDDCPLCGQILNGRIQPYRNGWAHKACVWAERGE